MDTITHGIAGALIGKGFFSEREGEVAVFAAAVGAAFPDCDVFEELFSNDPLAIVKFHRGITHSFCGLPFFALGLAWLTRAGLPLLQKRFASLRDLRAPSLGVLTLIYAIGIASHILLDGMTSFGTRMWTPLSNARIAWDWLFILDLVFTALVLVPQVAAWVHARRDGHLRRAFAMWLLLSLGAWGGWKLAGFVGFPFHERIVLLASLLFAAVFFAPAIGQGRLQISRAAWSRAGFCLTVVYVLACGAAHHMALRRVQAFAAENRLPIERIGALPLPPSLLDWGGVIRTNDGVYKSRFDLREAQAPRFLFTADSAPDSYTARALDLPEVKTYWTFARFPTIQSSTEGGLHIVDFSENRFITRRRNGPPPFSYRVVFDDAGNVVEEGWQEDRSFLRRMKRFRPAPGASSPADGP